MCGRSASKEPGFTGEKRMNRSHQFAIWSLLLGLAVTVTAACGYKVQSSVRSLPAGINSLGIPTFNNSTSQYRIEQRVTAAVLKEFSERTRVPVDSKKSGVDAVLLGDIRLINSSPVTYAADAYGSAFVVTVQVAVKLVRTSDSSVLWENPGFLFTERYVLTNKVTNYFPEEGPALDRLSHDFAASLTSTILSR
jgi:outer membrane lipopolysaccharide assembly protein LptE/RlpB